jgi:hypothetical protein
MSKQQKFDLKIHKPVSKPEDVILGRFSSNEFDIENIGQGTIHMKYMDEAIPEDIDITKKESSLFNARKKHDRYHKKTLIKIDEISKRNKSNTSIKQEGSITDSKIEGGSAVHYVLFEMSNKGTSSSASDGTVESIQFLMFINVPNDYSKMRM